MNKTESQVVVSLLDALDEEDNWNKALADICGHVGAKKAIIALRDSKTAELVIPTQVAKENVSPMLYGFSQNEVSSYLSEFYLVDPWTQYERAFRPYQPYALSKYIGINELMNSPFWEWLEPQGINDTIVCEIGFDKETWVGINFYYDQQSLRPEKILRSVQAVLAPLKKVWQITRSVQLSKASAGRSDEFLDFLDVGALVLDENDLICGFNKQALELEAQELIADVEVGKKLKVDRSGVKVHRKESNKFGEVGKDRDEADVPLFSISIRDVAEFETIIGIRSARKLLTIERILPLKRAGSFDIWENPSLTAQERVLVRIVAEGGRLSDFQRVQGISKPRSSQVSKSARDKLAVKKLSEIYVAHQIRQVSYT